LNQKTTFRKGCAKTLPLEKVEPKTLPFVGEASGKRLDQTQKKLIFLN